MLDRTDFNAQGSAPRYSYAHSPVDPNAYLILKYSNSLNAEPVPVGDYTVLDGLEDPSLSEKKVMNIVSVLNGRTKLVQLGEETKARMLYRFVDDDDDARQNIIFYHLGQEGVSVENALLRIEQEEQS
jgi:hypothetical protein